MRSPAISSAVPLAFALLAAALAAVALARLVGFLCALGPGPHIDAGAAPATRTGLAINLALNLALLAGFALPHSLLARASVKTRVAARVPTQLQRSLYVLIADLGLILLVVAWQPLPVLLLQVDAPGARAALLALALAGWGLSLLGALAVDARELFGLAPAWRFARGLPEPLPSLVIRGLYARLRQPINLGTLAALWATPDLSAGRLLFAATLSAYILVAARLEERDLAQRFGGAWQAYRAAVPALWPRWSAWHAGAGPADAS